MENKEQGAFACASDSGYQKSLTKREYFAAMAMQGMVARDQPMSGFSIDEASQCVFIADTLIKALEFKLE